MTKTEKVNAAETALLELLQAMAAVMVTGAVDHTEAPAREAARQVLGRFHVTSLPLVESVTAAFAEEAAATRANTEEVRRRAADFEGTFNDLAG